MQAFIGMLIFLRIVFDDYMISLLGIVMLKSFPFPCNHGYKVVVGSNSIYNCCQILDALMDTTQAFVNICDTTVMVLAMPVYSNFKIVKDKFSPQKVMIRDARLFSFPILESVPFSHILLHLPYYSG